MKKIIKTIDVGGKPLTLETGRFASQANGAVLAKLGETLVLATVVSASPKEDLDYFPLSVEYMERFYAGGRIKGSRWVKREGRPSDEAILTARLIDRSIRPLFPKSYKNEVQVIVTVLSVDSENNPDIPALVAVSAALSISNIPWNGPVGVVRVGYVPKNGESKAAFMVNPTHQDLQFSELDLVVAAGEKAVLMLEGGAKEVSEEITLQAVEFAQKEAQKIIKGIKELAAKVGLKKQLVRPETIDPQLEKGIEKEAGEKIRELICSIGSKNESGQSFVELKNALVEEYGREKRTAIGKIVDNLVTKTIREGIIKGKRPDGRKPEEIRPIEIEVGVLPRTHGSAIFKRGETQALTITTLGSPSLEQLIENMEGEETKRYIHHYFMPGFSVGEVSKMGWPSRREIGHGALAERALEPVIPSEEKFPYTIRVVSEIMSSNGSTSQASVCGSTLSLMDAGVPIKSPVAGIAMGKVGEIILSDILGIEDFNGDMDFKIAGTEAGITAIQLDVKTLDLGMELIKKVLARARQGRLFILEKMRKALPETRHDISKFAPKIEVVHVPVEKIGEVIGPGGRMIRKIIAETGAAVEVEDDGSVNVSAPTKESVKQAVEWINGLVKEAKVGEIYEGTVRRIQPFGAFVEILPGKEGLVHVSRMSGEFVDDPNKIVKVGQKVKVKVYEIDDMHRINLTMLLEATNKSASQPMTDRRSFDHRPGFSGSPRRPFSPNRNPQRGYR